MSEEKSPKADESAAQATWLDSPRVVLGKPTSNQIRSEPQFKELPPEREVLEDLRIKQAETNAKLDAVLAAKPAEPALPVPVVPAQRRTPRQKVNTALGKWRKANWKKVGKAADDAGPDNLPEFFTLLSLAEVPVRPDLKGDSWQKAYAVESQQGQIRTMKSHALADHLKSLKPHQKARQ